MLFGPFPGICFWKTHPNKQNCKSYSLIWQLQDIRPFPSEMPIQMRNPAKCLSRTCNMDTIFLFSVVAVRLLAILLTPRVWFGTMITTKLKLVVITSGLGVKFERVILVMEAPAHWCDIVRDSAEMGRTSSHYPALSHTESQMRFEFLSKTTPWHWTPKVGLMSFWQERICKEADQHTQQKIQYEANT